MRCSGPSVHAGGAGGLLRAFVRRRIPLPAGTEIPGSAYPCVRGESPGMPVRRGASDDRTLQTGRMKRPGLWRSPMQMEMMSPLRSTSPIMERRAAIMDVFYRHTESGLFPTYPACPLLSTLQRRGGQPQSSGGLHRPASKSACHPTFALLGRNQDSCLPASLFPML